MNTLILKQSEISALVAMSRAVDAVEKAFLAHGRGEALMPAKVYLHLPQDLAHEERRPGDFRAMPAFLAGTAGVKWVNAHPDNPARHDLPTVMALYVLSDPQTAQPLAVMDGTLLTALRTGAAAAVASRHLANKAPKSLGIVGCGVQARHFVAAHRAVFGDGLEVVVSDVRSAAASAFADEISGRAATVAEASGCSIVCIATPSSRPVIERRWVASGAHINAMGADAPGKQELDPQILLDARVFIDDWEQATHSGEVNMPLQAGLFDRSKIRGTLGEVVAGKTDGRASTSEVTVFDSTGLALQDLALARVVYDEARARGIGTAIDFRS